MNRSRSTTVTQMPTASVSNTPVTAIVEVPDIGGQGKMDVYAVVSRNGNGTATLKVEGGFDSAAATVLEVQAAASAGTGALTLVADGKSNKYTYLKYTLTPSGNNGATEWLTAKVYLVTY